MPKLQPLSRQPLSRQPLSRQTLSSRHRRAFSLLELIIVLVVMIGLMAVVWPNLQKPLSRTSLDEATQVVRTAIDESRYQATLAGTPWFVKLQVGAPVIHAGTFQTFMEADTDDVSGDLSGGLANSVSNSVSGSLSDSSNMTKAPHVRAWQLPDSVVISDVSWQLVDATQRSATSVDDRSLNSSPASELDPVPELQEATLQEATIHWLPIVASGRGRDATVVLWDQTTQQSARVVFVASTGAIEVLR